PTAGRPRACWRAPRPTLPWVPPADSGTRCVQSPAGGRSCPGWRTRRPRPGRSRPASTGRGAAATSRLRAFPGRITRVRPRRPSLVEDDGGDAALLEPARHEMAGLAAESAAIDDDVERRAQGRLELRECVVEVVLGQGQGARDVAHLVEGHG